MSPSRYIDQAEGGFVEVGLDSVEEALGVVVQAQGGAAGACAVLVDLP